jgi:hypothetical protein
MQARTLNSSGCLRENLRQKSFCRHSDPALRERNLSGFECKAKEGFLGTKRASE